MSAQFGTRLRKSACIFLAAATLAAWSPSAFANVTISAAATSNMSCSAGVCSPTAKKAVLNVTDLANMLASGDVAVKSNSVAPDVEIDTALSWTSANRLTLGSYHSITFNKPLVVAGSGALTITTNDGGTGGDFRFFGKGHVKFWNTNSSLVINGQTYVLANNIKKVRRLIRHDINGFYALSQNTSAKGHVYGESVIPALGGTLEGLGNTISNLVINGEGDRRNVAFIGELIFSTGMIRDIGLVNANITGTVSECVGALVGTNVGPAMILNSFATGVVSATSPNSVVGGLACTNQVGTIVHSHADVAVSSVGNDIVGGLVGLEEGCCSDLYHGPIDESYATGAVSGGDSAKVGGLVGRNLGGAVTDSYATGSVIGGISAFVGGLIGSNENYANQDTHPLIAASYSIGAVNGGSGATLGGLLGQDVADPNISDTYWNLDTSGVSNPHQGAGNINDDPGIAGLTDGQLKSDLPSGFDPSIWAQKANINNGDPYLIANPSH